MKHVFTYEKRGIGTNTCESAKSYCVFYFKWVNFMANKLYLNNTFKKIFSAFKKEHSTTSLT